MTDETYSPREAAALVEADTTTLSRYTREFPEFFSPTAREPAREGRLSRRYTSSDISVLRRVKSLYASGAVSEQVRDALNREFSAYYAPIGSPSATAPSPDPARTSNELVVAGFPSPAPIELETLLVTLYRLQAGQAHIAREHHQLVDSQRHFLTEQRQLVERQLTHYELYQDLQSKDAQIQRLQDELRQAEGRIRVLEDQGDRMQRRLDLLYQEVNLAHQRLKEIPDWLWKLSQLLASS